MPGLLTASSIIVSFCITLLILPYWIRRARKANLTGPDVHKKERPMVAELGGLCVVVGFMVSIMFFIATKIFIVQTMENLLYVFAILTAILIATIIGLVDDILGWKIGLRARYKVVLTFFIALPIIVINVGQTSMNFPFIGVIELGFLYPLIVIPIAIMGASNGFNMIAGYNGLEAGMGILILLTLSLLTYITGNTYLSLMGACMSAALLAFYFYNKYPAKIFPGDTLTYTVGALIAIIAILGNIEKYAVILFLPYFLELLLKARGNLIKESFAKVREDGSLENQYEQWYGLEHVAIDGIKRIKGNVSERNVVCVLFAFQFIFVILSIFVFYFK